MSDLGQVESERTERRAQPQLESPTIYQVTLERAMSIMDYLTEMKPSKQEGIELIQNALLDFAVIDTRTKLLNLVGLHYELNEAMLRAHTKNQPLSILVLDADRFKSINDTYGHRVGDLIIQAIAEAIKDAMRESDAAAHVNLSEPVASTVRSDSKEETAARPGGDEFVVIMAGSGPEGAQKLSARIQETVIPHLPKAPDVPESFAKDFSMTIGMATYDTRIDSDTHKFLERADFDMMERKKVRGVSRTQVETPKT